MVINSQFIEFILFCLQSAFTSVKNGINSLGNYFTGLGNTAIDLGNQVGQGVGDLGNQIKDGLTDAGNALEHAGSSIGHAIGRKLSPFTLYQAIMTFDTLEEKAL